MQYRGDKYVIKRHGKPAVAVVPVEIYENWKKQRQRLLELIHEVQAANPDADPDEVMQDVLEAQQLFGLKLMKLGNLNHACCPRCQYLY